MTAIDGLLAVGKREFRLARIQKPQLLRIEPLGLAAFGRSAKHDVEIMLLIEAELIIGIDIESVALCLVALLIEIRARRNNRRRRDVAAPTVIRGDRQAHVVDPHVVDIIRIIRINRQALCHVRLHKRSYAGIFRPGIAVAGLFAVSYVVAEVGSVDRSVRAEEAAPPPHICSIPVCRQDI